MKRWIALFLLILFLIPCAHTRASSDSIGPSVVPRPTLTSTDSVLVKMFDESVDVALRSVKHTQDGHAYIVAGPKYGNPERVYYRDSYWSSGLILFTDPSAVRDQILLLARGVEKNGSVPSAIPVNPKDRKLALWVNHFDSGPYLIMLAYDYIRFTGDVSVLNETVNGRTIFRSLLQIVSYLQSTDKDRNLLPEKPKNAKQDWVDSIPRGGEVLSDEVLYFQALRDLSELSDLLEHKDLALTYDHRSLLVRNAINDRFWNEKERFYAESCWKQKCLQRVSNESSLAVLFDVIDPNNRDRFFKSLQILETRTNAKNVYGDFGVLNIFPFYAGAGPVYVYQNGTDWPFLDGINGGARLKYHNADWYYPLTRWWTYFDEHRKPGERLPEYVSPIDPNHGTDQAWSTNPIASLLRYGFGLNPDLSGVYTQQASPIGEARLSNVMIRGRRVTIDLK